MKKIYFALAALSAALLASCEMERPMAELTPLGKNDIAFVMKGVSTRSAEETTSNAVSGVTIPMGKVSDGVAVCLEETIEELNPNPETKGAPVYTQNVGTVYTTMGVYATQGTFGGDATFEVMDMYQHDKTNAALGDGWRYSHNYNGIPWPADKNEKVDFRLRMPVNAAGVSNLSFDNQVTTFSYTSPSTENNSAYSQQDILFGHTSISRNEHDGYLPNGAPVTMYHALSAVKFRNGHANSSDTKTVITKVEISGLKSSGSCTVSTDATNPGIVNFQWNPSSSTAVFTQAYDNPTYTVSQGANNSDGTVSTWDSSISGTSWDTAPEGKDAASDHNLNNSKGELTFWFIPQEISDNVVLKVTFFVKTPLTPNGTEITHTINFGKQMNEKYTGSGNVEWKAGQLRTYTLKPYDVDVDIEDTIQGLVKSNLKIANTGNVPEYVRVLLLGNWYGWETEAEWNAWKSATTDEARDAHAPDIIVGYDSDGSDGRNVMVDPWYRGGYKHDAQGNALEEFQDNYGHFDDSFTLGTPQEGNKWIDASGGFYYPDPIGPGVKLNATTDALFKNYTITNIPDIYIATPTSNLRVKAKGVHLVLTVSVQAIGALDSAGNEKGWLEAWYEATGNKKLNPADHPEWAHNSSSGSGSGN